MVFAGLHPRLGQRGRPLRAQVDLPGRADRLRGCSTWAAFSGSVGMLIAARASMGVGGALIMPSTLAIITSMYTEPRRTAEGLRLLGGHHRSGGRPRSDRRRAAARPLQAGAPSSSSTCPSPPSPWPSHPLSCPTRGTRRAAAPTCSGRCSPSPASGLLLWAIIDAPSPGLGLAHGDRRGHRLASWCSPASPSGSALTSHPMLRLSFFRNRSFSVAVLSVSMVMLGLFGALFILTQYLQFDLGFTALADRDPHAARRRARSSWSPRWPASSTASWAARLIVGLGPAAHRRRSLADLHRHRRHHVRRDRSSG